MSRLLVVGPDFHPSILSVIDNKLGAYRAKHAEIESISDDGITVLQNLRSMGVM